MWNNYPDGMRESDIPGFNEYDIQIDASCNQTDVTLKFVDLDNVNAYITNIRKLINNEFVKTNNPELLKPLERLDKLKQMIADAIDVEVYECPFEGEVDGIGEGNEVSWTCPWCETEHQYEIPNPNE